MAVAVQLPMAFPGLHVPPTIESLTQSSLLYNLLPNDEVQPEDKFGIHLVHGNFQLEKDEVMLGTALESRRGCWTKPTRIVDVDPAEIHGHIFKFTCNGEMQAYEYREGSVPNLDGVDLAFFKHLADYVRDNDLESLLGLQVLAKDVPKTIEVNNWNPYCVTGFIANELGMTELKGAKSHTETTTGNHQVFISGKISKEDSLIDILQAEGSKLFQFRIKDSRIDGEIMTLAKAAHPEFVAFILYAIVEKAPATTGRRYQDLHEIDEKFNVLAQFLPPRFESRLVSIRRDLPSLFLGALPFVLCHGDLCEMNMLIDPTTGEITGIVDWAEARILPFGFSLWGFENVLGYMDSKGWHYYDNRGELESLFWKIFREEAKILAGDDLNLFQLARAAGLFCRYASLGMIDQNSGIDISGALPGAQ
ncbi:hypothetical protein MYU51_018331 [Penicillium brevicompactum]